MIDPNLTDILRYVWFSAGEKVVFFNKDDGKMHVGIISEVRKDLDARFKLYANVLFFNKYTQREDSYRLNIHNDDFIFDREFILERLDPKKFKTLTKLYLGCLRIGEEVMVGSIGDVWQHYNNTNSPAFEVNREEITSRPYKINSCSDKNIKAEKVGDVYVRRKTFSVARGVNILSNSSQFINISGKDLYDNAEFRMKMMETINIIKDEKIRMIDKKLRLSNMDKVVFDEFVQKRFNILIDWYIDSCFDEAKEYLKTKRGNI